jgi:hypothetical protein
MNYVPKEEKGEIYPFYVTWAYIVPIFEKELSKAASEDRRMLKVVWSELDRIINPEKRDNGHRTLGFCSGK